MKQYICTNNFSVPICDGNGFETDDWMIIEAGTIWDAPENEDYRFIGGDIRLESDELGWVEILNETFKQCFEEVEG